MQKNAIIAIILTFIVILLWGVIQQKYLPQPPAKPPIQEAKKEQSTPPVNVPDETKVTEGPEAPKGKALPEAKAIPKKDVFVETLHYWAVFTSDGARLKQFKLKKYLDSVEESPITIQLTQLVQGLLGKKKKDPKTPQPLDLVNTSEAEGLPLGLIIDSNPSLSAGNWEVDKEQLNLMKPDESGEISFSRSLDNGLTIVKRYGFNSERDTLDLEIEIQNSSSNQIPVTMGVEWIGKIDLRKLIDDGNRDFGLKYAYLKNQKVEAKDLGGSRSSGCTPGCSSPRATVEPFDISDNGDIRWFAFSGEYFTALLMPSPLKGNVTLNVKGTEKSLLTAEMVSSPLSVLPGQSVKIPYRVYLGPKETERLKELGSDAEKLIDFGYFTVVARPLLWFLRLTNNVTKNFGIDIIILSILIKIIFLPLTQISFKSMKEMQKVQPEMARLKELHKNDKARLQQETMLLYKRRKINPMSGCLPMVIQIPVFIALYNVLQNTFEMRHAPFMLWISDLSAKDPIYLTPLVMGATMVIQQKMTPSAADPAQAKLFMLMPIMFTFMFLSFPSGLVLYWLVTNVLSITHQYYLNKMT